MRHGLFATIALTFAVLIAAPAQAETLRFPEGELPAFLVPVPDGWKHNVTPQGTLELYAADGTASARFDINRTEGLSTDEMAAQLAKAMGASPPRNKTATLISNHFGNEYDSDWTHPDGGRFSLHIIAVAASGSRVAGVLLLLEQPATPARQAELERLRKGLTLISEPSAPLNSWR